MPKIGAKIVKTSDGRLGIVKNNSEPINGKVPVYLQIEKSPITEKGFTVTYNKTGTLFKPQDLEQIGFIDGLELNL